MAQNERKIRVAIIGAGASGLAAIKCCLDEDLMPVCFEKSDGIGGLWRFSETTETGRAGVYRSTTINTSKELLAYSTFPPPPNFPNFMHNTKLYEYMCMYADNFSLKKYIRFNCEVVSVVKDEDFEKNSSWVVKSKDYCLKDGDVRSELFDAVMVCTGHHAYPNNPAESIRGVGVFRGKVSHGHQYKNHKPFENRRVMVVGLGNTGGDIAAEVSRHASKLYLSTRRGAWVINRIAERGLPYDVDVVTRIFSIVMKYCPMSVLNWFYESKMNRRFDHLLYGLKPNHRIMSQHPLVNDELPTRIANGSVNVVPDVREFTENGVITANGGFHEVDDVIFATGYVIKFPFLSNDVISVDKDNNICPLYKHVFPLHLSTDTTLAMIGNVQPLGGLMPIAEMQARWATRVFKGVTKLPSYCVMKREVQERTQQLRKRYIGSKRHTIQVDYLQYMDTLAEEIGVKPNLSKLFFSHPTLAWKILTGPATAYQFRLNGPGAWEGAPEAIEQQWERVKSGFGGKSQCKPKETKNNKSKS